MRRDLVGFTHLNCTMLQFKSETVNVLKHDFSWSHHIYNLNLRINWNLKNWISLVS